MSLHPWQEKKLIELHSDANPEEIFNRVFRQHLGEHADRAWTICKKFIDHGIADPMEIIANALENDKVVPGLKALEDLWENIVVGRNVPIRSQMTDNHQELLVNSFLIADLQVQ